MKDVIAKVKFSSVKSLTHLVISAMDNAAIQIEAQTMRFTFTLLPPIRQETSPIAERFMRNLNQHFDGLTTLQPKEPDVTEYGSLSLVDDDRLEAIIAMEGMVNHARNCDIEQYISFTTRLDTLLPNVRIDETNNPLDPQQIGDCFSEAIREMGLSAHYLLTIYREFNKAVFHKLENVLAEANETMITLGVLPDLDIQARNKELQKTKRALNRPTTDAETRAFSGEPDSGNADTGEEPNAEMFAMMQTLVKALSSSSAEGSDLPIATAASAENTDDIIAEHQDLKKQQAQLKEMLTDIQAKIQQQQSPAEESTTTDPVNTPEAISESINKSLEASSTAGEIETIDSKSSDVINLVTLMYAAIWKDDSLPEILKELIGRTQIAIMKLALADSTFFDAKQHPGRVLLNEFAMAGITWTDRELLSADPVYSKVEEMEIVYRTLQTSATISCSRLQTNCERSLVSSAVRIPAWRIESAKQTIIPRDSTMSMRSSRRK